MLTKGNSKLGRNIWTWSIPAGITCPGKTELCNDRCYAQKGFFCMPNVENALFRNYDATQLDTFTDDMIDDIKSKKARVVRIHVAGDFYDWQYVKKWQTIARKFPDVRFFTYTRSWRKDSIVDQLREFNKTCPNVRMWWSVDRETGYPRNLPASIRTAYMSVEVDDIPDPRCDLVFRDYQLRDAVVKRINGVFVCPPENGITTKLTCEKCGYCWRTDRVTKKKGVTTTRSRVPLQMVR